MASTFVVGLFESKGIAEDAVNRLKHEGVPPEKISLQLLRETTSRVPPTVQSELAALSVDPLVIGDAQENFVEAMANGETLVFVQAEDETEAQFAVDTIRQYMPLRIRTVTVLEGVCQGAEVTVVLAE